MRIKAVFDTNTIISGLIFKGNESRLLDLVDAEKIRLYTSPELIKELSAVLDYPKIQKVLIKQNISKQDCLNTILENTTLLEPNIKIKAVSDPDDNKVLECAQEAQADYIISGDKHLLKLKKHQQTAILKAKEFLEKIKSG
jgi:uncharacterized protein